MQILVFGMHRSGTSVVARLLNMMGAYFAPEGASTGANAENPKGFWERRDVRDVNDRLLHAAGADWNRLSTFSIDDLPPAALAEFKQSAREIIIGMDAHRPWFLKEPRFCVLGSLWLQLLEVPIPIIVHRSPLEVARSLEVRNGFPLDFSLALWERYNVDLLNATLQSRRIQVDHAHLMRDAVSAVASLFSQLQEFGVRTLTLPSADEVRGFIDPSLHRARQEERDRGRLNQGQRQLFELFESGQALLRQEPLPFSPESQHALVQGDLWIDAHYKVADVRKVNLNRLADLSHLRERLESNDRALAKSKDELKAAQSAHKEQRAHWEQKVREHALLLQRREGQLAELREAYSRVTDRAAESEAKAAALASEAAVARGREEERAMLVQHLEEHSDILQWHKTQAEAWRKMIDGQESSLSDERAKIAQRDEQVRDLEDARQEDQQELRRITRENRILERGLKRIEKDFDRLRQSKSFHFLAYTMRRLGLVSRTPRVSVEGIRQHLAEASKKLRQAKKEQRSPTDHPLLAVGLEIKAPSSDSANEAAATAPSASFAATHATHPPAPAPTPAPPHRAGIAKKIPPAPGVPKADVIICVHNALADVELCLSSVVLHATSRLHRLIIVNDGSDEETTLYLRHFAHLCPLGTILLEHPEPSGYTKAANRGLQAVKAAYAILLNSDTIVTSRWLEQLIACGESDPMIGIVGPLSNAASWQSVPERYSPGGDWAVNEMEIESLDRIASAYRILHAPEYPKVPLLNGFCFALKKEVTATIGLLDEEAFPKGYGEENDFCLRAAAAGFSLGIADDCYIFHAKSRSYSHEKRRELAKESGRVLRARYGAAVNDATSVLRDSPALERARQDFGRILAEPPLSILFLMNFRGFGGGVSSIVQEADGLRKLGAAAQVAIRPEDEEYYRDRFPNITPGLFLPFQCRSDLLTYAASFDVVVATLFTGVRILRDIVERHPSVCPCYYIQDYEPNFFSPHETYYQEALESYTLIPNVGAFAKTDWLCQLIAEKHGISVTKVVPSIDQDIFFCGCQPKPSSPKVICAMVRPHTPRRSPGLTFSLLRQAKLEFGEEVEIRIFGLKEDHVFLDAQATDFDYHVLGILDRQGVAELLRESFLFIDASTYQAFGRTGLEAMACGCATILPREGGPTEYAIDGVNTFLASPTQPDSYLALIRNYLNDTALHQRVVQNGLKTAAHYSIERACRSELEFFETAFREQSTAGDGMREAPAPVHAEGDIAKADRQSSRLE